MIVDDLNKISTSRIERLNQFKEELKRMDEVATASNAKSPRQRSPAKFL